jgi:RHS repeat-associated protein
VWSYPNVHGDVQATATSAGVKQGATVVYDPFGLVVTGSVPDNVLGGMDYGWVGQHQQPLERGVGLKQVIEMGARPYQPLLGRFLTVDPIEGGTPNAYVYVHDPINDFDLTGMCSRWNLPCKALEAAKKAAKKAYKHVTVGYGGCLFVCVGVKFQGGYLSFSGGEFGFSLKAGPTVGWATKQAVDRERCAAGGHASYYVGTGGSVGIWGSKPKTPGVDYEQYLVTGFGGSFGPSCSIGFRIPGL